MKTSEKRIHFDISKPSKRKISKVQPICMTTGSHRLLGTRNESEITCKRCLEVLESKKRVYKCPVCGKLTEYLVVWESVIQQSEITATKRFKRRIKSITQRRLITLKCPICYGDIPTDGLEWRDLHEKLVEKAL